MENQSFKLYEKKQVPLLVIVLAGLLTAVMWSYWLSPLWDQTKQALLDEVKIASTVNAKNDELSALEKFKIFLTKDQDKVNLLQDVLPKEENLDDVLIQMERLAVNNNIFVRSINITDNAQANVEVVPGEVSKTTLMIQLEGEYPNMLNFIDSLQKSTRLIAINKFGVAANLSQDAKAPIYTIEMQVFYQK